MKIKSEKTKPPISPSKRKVYLILSKVLLLAAIVVLIVGLVISLNNYTKNVAQNKKAAKLVYEANHNINHIVPATTPVTESAYTAYTVAPNKPRYIMIPSISVNAIVNSVGLTSAGAIGTPNNVYNTAWFNRSPAPGQLGASIIDGHVSSWTSKGVFYNLKNLVAGDSIKVVMGSGSVINFIVVKTQTYNYQNINMAAVLAPINSKVPGLNIITCGGDVLPGTNEFSERIVVFAEEV